MFGLVSCTHCKTQLRLPCSTLRKKSLGTPDLQLCLPQAIGSIAKLCLNSAWMADNFYGQTTRAWTQHHVLCENLERLRLKPAEACTFILETSCWNCLVQGKRNNDGDVRGRSNIINISLHIEKWDLKNTGTLCFNLKTMPLQLTTVEYDLSLFDTTITAWSYLTLTCGSFYFVLDYPLQHDSSLFAVPQVFRPAVGDTR